MTTAVFPIDPAIGDSSIRDNITYEWNGTVWMIVNSDYTNDDTVVVLGNLFKIDNSIFSNQSSVFESQTENGNVTVTKLSHSDLCTVNILTSKTFLRNLAIPGSTIKKITEKVTFVNYEMPSSEFKEGDYWVDLNGPYLFEYITPYWVQVT